MGQIEKKIKIAMWKGQLEAEGSDYFVP